MQVHVVHLWKALKVGSPIVAFACLPEQDMILKWTHCDSLRCKINKVQLPCDDKKNVEICVAIDSYTALYQQLHRGPNTRTLSVRCPKLHVVCQCATRVLEIRKQICRDIISLWVSIPVHGFHNRTSTCVEHCLEATWWQKSFCRLAFSTNSAEILENRHCLWD